MTRTNQSDLKGGGENFWDGLGVEFEGVHTPGICRCARTIENFSRIRKVAARASGMDLASSLKGRILRGSVDVLDR